MDSLRIDRISVESLPAQPFKDKNFSLYFLKEMIRARVLEERLIKMMRTGEGYFWIGGPGEEAINISLGLQVNKGFGVAHDFLHLHYRSNAVLMAMENPLIDFIRQMRSTATDPFSGGRNFVSHICKKEWNIVPVTSPIETQFSISIGTALAQKRARSAQKPHGVSIVVGGDAGTAEGDFATALIWSSRPGAELPLLMIVTNNQFGISTAAQTQHGEKTIADRAKAFHIEHAVCEGNHPEKAWSAVAKALEYVRETGRPYLLEAHVSRLYGHSSSSGANRVTDEVCVIDQFSKKLIKQNWLNEEQLKSLFDNAWTEVNEALEKVKQEPLPESSTVLNHSFANGEKGGVPGSPSGGGLL